MKQGLSTIEKQERTAIIAKSDGYNNTVIIDNNAFLSTEYVIQNSSLYFNMKIDSVNFDIDNIFNYESLKEIVFIDKNNIENIFYDYTKIVYLYINYTNDFNMIINLQLKKGDVSL